MRTIARMSSRRRRSSRFDVVRSDLRRTLGQARALRAHRRRLAQLGSMRSSSRYFATVRRATVTPSSESISARRWSDSGLAAFSSRTSSRSRCLMLVAATSVPVRGPIAAAEEVLQLEQAVRRGHVLAGDSARDGGQVHAELDRDVFEPQRPEQAVPVLEELRLHLQDDLRDPGDRVLAPVDVLDEALRRADLVLQVASRLVIGGRAALEHATGSAARP